MEQTDIKRRMLIERALPIHIKCFNACHQFQLAKIRHELCPFPQSTLDVMFAKEK